MAFLNTGGFDQAFLDPPAKLKEFECPLCLLVIREPNLTSCCGQHFCQSCINRVLTDRKPCPFCKQQSFNIMPLDKKQRRKVLELKVSCSMKDRGCRWTGELGELPLHTDTRNGNCQFVDATCPNSCGESHQRRYLNNHLSNTCRKRPFTCEHCMFKATHELVCQHYNQCERFPLSCPNQCEIVCVERTRMSDHLSECPLQLIQCEYADAGCEDKFQRKYLAMHTKQNAQKHLLLVFTASQQRIATLERKLDTLKREKQAQLEEKETQIATLKLEFNKYKRKIEAQLGEQDQKIAALEQKIEREMEAHTRKTSAPEQKNEAGERPAANVQTGNRKELQGKDGQAEVVQKTPCIPNEQNRMRPPVEFTINDYSLHKETENSIHCATFYMSGWGAKLLLQCYFGAQYSVFLELYQVPGEIDDEVEWPLKCRVTVHLLNQLSDCDHISGSKTVTLTRPKEKTYTGSDPLQVPYATIEDRSKQGIQYLKDNCLKFKIYVDTIQRVQLS